MPFSRYFCSRTPRFEETRRRRAFFAPFLRLSTENAGGQQGALKSFMNIGSTTDSDDDHDFHDSEHHPEQSSSAAMNVQPRSPAQNPAPGPAEPNGEPKVQGTGGSGSRPKEMLTPPKQATPPQVTQQNTVHVWKMHCDSEGIRQKWACQGQRTIVQTVELQCGEYIIAVQ